MRRLWLFLALWLGAVPLAHAQVIGQPTNITAQSSSVCATANAFAAFPVGNSASLTFGITGTWSGTLTFKSTADGSTWVTTQVTNLGSGTTPVTTATANGQFGLSNSGLLSVCVDATSFASGTATVTVTRGWSAKGGGATNGGGGSTVTGGTCTNQVTTAISTSGVPTCTTVTSAYKDTSIASTGVDINTSYQVTATHLASALPVAQGGWGLATLTVHDIYVGNGTSAPTAIAGCTNGSLTWTASSVDPSSAIRALFHGKPSNPSAVSSVGTPVMLGLGTTCTITPTSTGRVVFTLSGDTNNSVAADAVEWEMRYGTGTAPANGAGAAGTVISAQHSTSGSIYPASVTTSVTGLTPSTAYWFDLGMWIGIGGTATINNVDCTAYEI